MEAIHRIALFAMMWVWMIPTANAQENLLKNGDFEGAWSGSYFDMSPEGWKVHRAATERVSGKRDGGSGANIFMAYLDNGGSIRPIDNSVEAWRAGALHVEKGASYKLTVWHKCTRDNLSFYVNFNFYKRAKEDDQYKSNQSFSFKTQKDQWVKFEQVIKIPENEDIDVASMSISFAYRRNEKIYFDDISLVKSEGGSTTPEVEKPEKPRLKYPQSFQREITVSWEKSHAEGITYEVKDGKQTYTGITGNSFTVEKLTPGQTYNIEVCAVKDGVRSEYAKTTAGTKNFERPVGSEGRIPYLRTIEPAGSCKGRFLKLYYNDLANPDAKISYKLDGKPVQPKDNTLEFPAFEGYYKRFQLEIHIDEGEGREWEILYNELSVQNF
ncbi:carbohydrate binding domain protein [Bacteroides pyogenes F0041]|uniref:Carbohydrate binding domain protein n=1 Tax=Bacteroides pyogenes F0041 TaxID=1321819 RepID=U2DXT2_9BACE|nr:fibronectin type III domain-containing protein [Bacteroides pyogenes]ERI86502.1 carbohydrate binding domain protein [Bacteroides pyogenes F0041]